ncbi:serine hydrolase domain-containing protein [Microbulbifer spongiae]|uniref:Beta-lactamase family protein n=1 Tax=Microbulbifer spongiae TaxID=2944933 RepID=A0ABY9E9M4_9GAMM|nr:serine hydrolase [Microbulbifer sp. MI-G]WKD48616.1 beta-lactamase family protein [Microbulbifer sp. MI-G]
MGKNGAKVLKRIVIYTLILFFMGLPTFFWVTYRLEVKRAFYPIESAAAYFTIQCSEVAPGWMYEALEYAIFEGWALANQLAYVSPEGELHHCESGWLGPVIFSSKIDKNTRFRFASMSKLFVADTALEFINDELLKLDDDLIKFLPALNEVQDRRVEQIKVEQLLTHSAGFDRERSGDPMFTPWRKPWCPYQPERLASLTLDFYPGERFVYSNLGYCFLGIVVEQVSGQEFKDLISTRYALKSKRVKFVENEYFPDEVEYDFRNSNFFGREYTSSFDFHALSSSAGLSGNASALADKVNIMLSRKPLNLLSGFPVKNCDVGLLENCFGYGLFEYRLDDQSFSVYIQSGHLFGMAGSVVIDEFGGVTVRLGNGAPNGPANDGMNKFLYKTLANYYNQY